MTSYGSFAVPLDKPRLLRSLGKRLVLLLVLVPVFSFALSEFFRMTDTLPSRLLPPGRLTASLPMFVPLCALYWAVGLLASGAVVAWTVRSTRPSLLVTEEGVDVHTVTLSGMVRWSDVGRITVFRWGRSRYLGIGLRDPMNWFGRLPPLSAALWRALWATMTLCHSLGLFRDVPPISIPEDQFAVPAEEVARRLEEHRW